MATQTKFDLSIFAKDTNECQCKENQHQNCTSITRLFVALKYYSMMKVVDDKENQDIFINFVNVVYPAIVDDYAHFKQVHSCDIEQIFDDLMDKNSMLYAECKLSSCQFTQRHYDKIQNDKLDPVLKFYAQTFDSLHFYLFHTFEAGFRNRTDTVNEEQKQKHTARRNDKYFDGEFETRNASSSQRRHHTDAFARFSTKKNTKFNITTDIEYKSSNVNDDDTTYLDEMCKYFQRTNVDKYAIQKFKDFTEFEEYDTDAIEYDMDIDNGNIAKWIDDKQFIYQMKSIKASSSSFSIGLRLYYWDYYQSIRELPDEQQQIGVNRISNYNDHSGYAVSNLFISRKYANFKEEICNYEYFDNEQYEESCVKVKYFENSKIVKSIKAKDTDLNKYYEIKQGQPLLFDHLLSVILYTDYTDLSSNFTSTFRKSWLFETIDNLKIRNANYYWFSRRLRECVELYGECARGDYDENSYSYTYTLTGPFYSGMNKVMNMPSFNIRLCSPTSTSTQIEVALRFSGTTGIVIQLNNPKVDQHKYLRGFDVSWISRFGLEEDERLFFGGYYFIKVDSIRIRSTNQNFQRFMYALYYLDTMVTGGEQEHVWINEHNEFMVSELIKHALGKPTSTNFDPYIYSTFISFAQSKQQIVLDLNALYEYANDEIKTLIMYPLSKRVAHEDTKREDFDESNLFRSEMLDIFGNVNSVIIKSTSVSGVTSYSLSMKRLLLLLKSSSVNNIIIKACTFTYYFKTQKNVDYNWIQKVWMSSGEQLQKQYDQIHYGLTFKKSINEQNKIEYWFVINRKE